MSDQGDEPEVKAKTGDVDVHDTMPCMALCCCICSFYFQCPDCFGSVCTNTCLCCLCKVMTCKAAKEEGIFCKLLNMDCDCIHFKTCCQSTAQAFCVDTRIAFPPTAEIPCMLTCCLITCCYQNNCVCKCATDVRDIEQAVGGREVKPYKLDRADE